MNPYTGDIPFSMERFLSELNRQEIILFRFLSDLDSSEKIRLTLTSIESIESFFHTLNSRKNVVRQLDTAVMQKELLEKHKKNDVNVLWKMMQKESEQLFEKAISLYAWYGFIGIMFHPRIEKWETERNQVEGETEAEWWKHEVAFAKKHFLFKDRPALNMLGTLLYVALLQVDEEESGIKIEETIRKRRRYLLLDLFWRETHQIAESETERWKTEKRKEEMHRKKAEEEREKLKKQNQRYQEQLKEAKSSIKQLEKEAKESHQNTNGSLMKTLYDTIQKKDKQLEKEQAENNRLRNEREKPHPIYENIIQRLEKQVSDCKAELTEKKILLRNWQKRAEEAEAQTWMERLLKAKEDKQVSSELFDFLQEKIREFEQKNEKTTAQEERDAKTIRRIGYCRIENGTYSVQFPNRQCMPLKDVPENVYIADKQFVLADEDGTFRWNYPWVYHENDLDYQLGSFLSVRFNEKGIYYVDGSHMYTTIVGLPKETYFKENQIFAVGKDNRFQRFYSRLYVNADTYLPSIKAKGHVAYYVRNVFTNGYLLRHIETGEEMWKDIVSEKPIPLHSVIVLDGDRCVHVFASGAFYTLSSYYTKAEHGTYHLVNDTPMMKKVSGELIAVKGIPPQMTLKEGDTIIVDEDGEFLKRNVHHNDTDHTVERRIRVSVWKGTDKKTEPKDYNVTKKALVVGNINYEESYRNAFRKKGYETDVIDGYLPWSKVKSEARGKDIVVIITNFVSHENMWQAKEEINHIPLLFSDEDGANRVADKLPMDEVST